jgi:hypothetical protein
MLRKDYDHMSSAAKKKTRNKKNSVRESQGAWRQDELIGEKPSSHKVTLTLTLTENNVRLEEE